MAIHFYSKSDTHREFSNFAPFGIDLDDARWPTVEHYYQAQKFTDAALRKAIRKAEKPPIAKSLADKNKTAIRPDWDQVKDEVMYRAVRRKFELHPELRDMLLATGDEELVEFGADRHLLGRRPRRHRPKQAWQDHRSHPRRIALGRRLSNGR